jgi:hypothetical protein
MVSILHREMRIASRRRWTFWSRVVTSALAFISGLFLILISSMQATVSGTYLFKSLVFSSFWFCLIQGVRRASASISDERREGTLGLLFLTDLRPIDVIAGKLFAVAIPLIQPLLAFLPVLAISVLLGGITGGEIFRAGLTLASILLYSISAGLFVSCVSRKAEETGQGTIFLLLAMVALPPIFGRGPLHWLRYFSPWSAYTTIPDPGYRVSGEDFWYSLLVTNLFAAALLLAAGYFLRRRDDEPLVVNVKSMRAFIPKPRVNRAAHAAILDRNPGEWLAVRHSMGPAGKWIFNGITFAFAVFAAVLANAFNFPEGRYAALAVLLVTALLILLRLASQASYPLAEARRSGAIEMMISTPLNPKCLITGQLISLRNQFLPALGMLLIASVFIIGLQRGEHGILEIAESMIAIGLFWGALALVTSTVAAFGMWMGLREPSPNAAFFKTLVFTILPLLLGGCLRFALPVGYLIVLLVAVLQITGRDLQRLLRKEKKFRDATPLGAIVPAPPIISS